MGIFSGWSLKNPLQPITHAVGKTAGITANTHNGIHVDPARLAMTAASFALPGVGTALSKIPGIGGALGGAANAIGGGERALLGKLPGAAMIAHTLGLGGSGNAGTAMSEQPPAGGWQDPTGGVANGVGIGSTAGSAPDASGGSWLDTILGNAKAEAGRVVRRVSNGQSPISVGGGDAAGAAGAGMPGGGGAGRSGGLSPLLLELLAGAQGVSAAHAYSKMGDLQDKALNTAETNYAQRAPLRTAGIQGMTAAPVRLNLPSTGNPFATGAAA